MNVEIIDILKVAGAAYVAGATTASIVVLPKRFKSLKKYVEDAIEAIDKRFDAAAKRHFELRREVTAQFEDIKKVLLLMAKGVDDQADRELIQVTLIRRNSPPRLNRDYIRGLNRQGPPLAPDIHAAFKAIVLSSVDVADPLAMRVELLNHFTIERIEEMAEQYSLSFNACIRAWVYTIAEARIEGDVDAFLRDVEAI